MNETELKNLFDRISNGVHIEISELSEEQKNFLKAFIENLKKACETIADFLNNVFAPAFEDCFNKLFKTLNISNDKYSQKVVRYKMLEKQTIRPIYLDKRRRTHICSRSNC